ncbi:MAG: glutathione S-transferase family protein [Phycisphaerae bacterium]|nr:glutathione S-transferase family protein [Phycisphaerae bacterium]
MSPSPIQLFGINFSPFVRKVRTVLELKQVPYELVPTNPREADDAFYRISPLRKMPAIIDGDRSLPDSSVICAYLERKYPSPAALPTDAYEFARSLWFEEYADTELVRVFGGHVFVEVVLAEKIFKRPPIQADIDLADREELPHIYSYLEGELGSRPCFCGDEPTLGDFALAGAFLNLRHCDRSPDASQWPKLAAFVKRMNAHPILARFFAEEEQTLANWA